MQYDHVGRPLPVNAEPIKGKQHPITALLLGLKGSEFLEGIKDSDVIARHQLQAYYTASCRNAGRTKALYEYVGLWSSSLLLFIPSSPLHLNPFMNFIHPISFIPSYHPHFHSLILLFFHSFLRCTFIFRQCSFLFLSCTISQYHFLSSSFPFFPFSFLFYGFIDNLKTVIYLSIQSSNHWCIQSTLFI